MFVVYYYKIVMKEKYFTKYFDAENFAQNMATQGYKVDIDRV